MSEMALTWRLVTGCGGGMADARNVASPAACASSGSRHAPHAGALPSPTLSPTDPVPQGPLTLWARAGPVYAYMYVCVHAHARTHARARAHARTHTHHIYNGSAIAQKVEKEQPTARHVCMAGRGPQLLDAPPPPLLPASILCASTQDGGRGKRGGRGEETRENSRVASLRVVHAGLPHAVDKSSCFNLNFVRAGRPEPRQEVL